jgi:ABC-type antimicrobial peptide transport system permease subunit
MRSLYAMAGIILAISFFTGSFIAIDSASNAMVRSSIAQTPADFECFAYPVGYKLSGFEKGEAALESVDNVVEASPVIEYDVWNINKPNSTVDFSAYNSYMSGTLAFIDQNSTLLLERLRINGTVPEAGTVAISKYMAESLGIGLNENINISRLYAFGEYINETYVPLNDTYLNLTYRVSQIWTQGYTTYTENGSETFQSSHIQLGGYYSNPVIFNLADADGLIAKANQWPQHYLDTLAVRYEVLVDRDKVISAGDIGGTLARLDFIGNRLEYKGMAIGVYYVQSNLAGTIGSISGEMANKKELFLALSMPVMLLGTYLSMVGIDLATFDRRREIGIIKARGGTKRQVLGEMIVESVLLGTGSAIIGLLGGILISRFLLGVSTSFIGAVSSDVSLGEISVDSGTLAIAILFGIILMVISSYRPIGRLIKMETSEALHIFTPIDARKEYNPRWDFAALGLSVACIFGAVATSEKWFQGSGNSFIVTILIAIVGVMGIALLPLLPVLLSMSIIRLLTRGPRRLYTKFAAVMRPWTKEVQPLVEVNIERNPKRSSMICMVIALAVAFGLFVSVTMESTLAYEIDKVRYQIGADIGGQASWFSWNYDQTGKQVNLSRLDALNSTQGVRSICRWANVGQTNGTNSLSLSLFDPDVYYDTVRPADFWFEGTGSSILGGLKKSGTALIPQSMADDRSILVGDTLPVKLEFKRANMSDLAVNLNLEIIGIVKGLPGMSEISSYPGQMDFNLYADRKTLASVPDQLLMNSSSGVTVGILVAINQGVNHAAVAIAVNDAFVDAGLSNAWVRDVAFEIEIKKKDPYIGALTQFLNTEYASSMGIMTVGVAMIIFVTVRERKQEIACIMARGSTSKQMTKMLMGESITLMMLGLVTGTAVGLLTAYLYNYMTAALANQVGHSLVLTYVSLSILLVAVIAMLVVSFLTTVRAGKIKLAEVLRIRGG